MIEMKKLTGLVLCLFIVLPLNPLKTYCAISASADSGWKGSYETGWWWLNEDGTWPANGWFQRDGLWYYFNEDGYILLDTVTPDGYRVDQTGAWIETDQGEVQVANGDLSQAASIVGRFSGLGPMVQPITADITDNGDGTVTVVLNDSTWGVSTYRMQYKGVTGEGLFRWQEIGGESIIDGNNTEEMWIICGWLDREH